jgi:serine/threonine protein kinase
MDTPNDLLRCPITFELFHDPVLAQDGHTYERQKIEEWIQNSGTSPMTREPLSIEQLRPNRIVKDLVDAFERFMRENNYQFILNVHVRIKDGWPIFQAFGKTIYRADWLPDNNNRPEIILLRIDGTRAKKEASFYVNLSRHPHIIRTFGFVYDENIRDQDNTVLLLQEYAPKGNLYEFLRNRRTAPEEKILIEIFLQIIEAMICLADNHVVHGDLACRNILVFRFEENQPEMNVVKIVDFGLSRHSPLYARTSGAARTVLDTVPVRYAAPEVLSSPKTSEVYTEKSDIYSMGVLMWEAYSRCSVPWESIDDDDVVRRVRNGDLLTQPPNCTPPFWSIITKTWSHSPSNRPTFSELKRFLTEQYYRSGNFLNICLKLYSYVVSLGFTSYSKTI